MFVICPTSIQKKRWRWRTVLQVCIDCCLWSRVFWGNKPIWQFLSFIVCWFQDWFPTSKLAKRAGKKIPEMNDGANNFIIRIEINSHRMWSHGKTMKDSELGRLAKKKEGMKTRERLKDKRGKKRDWENYPSGLQYSPGPSSSWAWLVLLWWVSPRSSSREKNIQAGKTFTLVKVWQKLPFQASSLLLWVLASWAFPKFCHSLKGCQWRMTWCKLG